MAKRGAKPKYEKCVQPYLAEIRDKVRQGVTEAEIAKALGISVASLSNYKNQYPELAEALSKDRGADVLRSLVNAGVQAALGYTKKTKQEVFERDESGEVVLVRRVDTEENLPPNPALNRFYVQNFGKDQGYVGDPLEYQLRKQKQEFAEEIERKKNWHLFN
jgi:transcriptional regulator with XRE-family HTH domain